MEQAVNTASASHQNARCGLSCNFIAANLNVMAGLQPDIYAAISITWIAAFVALILRLKARGMMKTKLWYDDYFAIVALVCYVPWVINCARAHRLTVVLHHELLFRHHLLYA